MNNATTVTAAELTEYNAAELGLFAMAVKAAAAAPSTAKYYDELAYIGSVKQEWFPRTDTHDFCAMLLACLQAGMLRMARADLVGAMNPVHVAASEITYLSGWGKAEFHFIVL
jgi:putative heme degradation protein